MHPCGLEAPQGLMWDDSWAWVQSPCTPKEPSRKSPSQTSSRIQLPLTCFTDMKLFFPIDVLPDPGKL